MPRLALRWHLQHVLLGAELDWDVHPGSDGNPPDGRCWVSGRSSYGPSAPWRLQSSSGRACSLAALWSLIEQETFVAARGSWTHLSVVRFAAGRDPVQAIQQRAQEVVLQAMDAGWSGPPFDPLALAKILFLPVVGRDAVRDARTVPLSDDRVQIEYNPSRPPARVRYSLAHEIAHTLFPDCAEQVRNRGGRAELQGDEWQLEVLCNIAAAEFLMPVGTMPHLRGEALQIENLMRLRESYAVSAEALLIRVARLADEPCAAVCASRVEKGRNAGRYRLDYLIGSEEWGADLPKGMLLPEATRLAECVAIGFTAKGEEVWEGVGKGYLECVGIPAYPGAVAPRVVGILRSRAVARSDERITIVRGDATKPRGDGQKIVVHVVNDATPRWGGRGFASAVARVWPDAQKDFVRCVEEDRSRLKLGSVYEYAAATGLTIVHMVAQHGYGPSPAPRIRYAALRTCLAKVAELALTAGASVHMPRIGAGEAGGSWALIEELVAGTLCAAGIHVTVYDLPGSRPAMVPQIALDFESNRSASGETLG